MLVMKTSLSLFHMFKEGSPSVMLLKVPFFTINFLLHAENIWLAFILYFESRICKQKTRAV